MLLIALRKARRQETKLELEELSGKIIGCASEVKQEPIQFFPHFLIS